MADYEQAGANNPDGIKIGRAATSKVGFYGATPVVQQTAATAFAAGDSTNTMGAAINAINTALKNIGIAA
jgi:hypothetical protein